jgi:hypothetical protein
MKLGVSRCPRVLLGGALTELDMRPDGLPEWLVVGQARLVERLHVERHESLQLLVGDFQVTMHVDDVLNAELTCEAIGPAERLGREPETGRSIVESWPTAEVVVSVVGAICSSVASWTYRNSTMFCWPDASPSIQESSRGCQRRMLGAESPSFSRRSRRRASRRPRACGVIRSGHQSLPATGSTSTVSTPGTLERASMICDRISKR